MKREHKYSLAILGTWVSAMIIFFYFVVVRNFVDNGFTNSMTMQEYKLLSLPILAISFVIAGASWHFRNKYGVTGDRKVSKINLTAFFIVAGMLIVAYLIKQ